MAPTRYAAYAALVATARRRAALWRLIAGLVLAFTLYGGSAVVAVLAGERFGIDVVSAARGNGTPLATAVLLLSFSGLGAGTLLAAFLFHGRGPSALLGLRNGRFGRHFAIAAGAVVTVLLAATLADVAISGAVANLTFAVWMAWVPLALALVLVQTGSEELLFRGYLQSQLAARFGHPVVWLGLPAVLFGLMHYDTATLGANAPLVVLDTFVIGLIAGDLTAKTGTLGAAMGLHFANNTVALLVHATQGTVTGLALWRSAASGDDTGMGRLALVGELLLAVVLYSVYLWAVARNSGTRLHSQDGRPI